VLATQLAGNYNNNQTYAGTTATSPPIDLSTTTAPTLHFWVWHVTESGWDGFNIKASSDGVSYTQLLNVTPVYNQTLAGEQCWAGTSAGWVEYEADLSAFAGDQVNLRFAFRSDASGLYPGVYIDDLEILD
jgi:bacillopeptidase F (M6 metalloprotease family)